MALEDCDILLLLGRLSGREAIQSLKGLVERLEEFGHRCRVVCCSADADHGLADLIESPGLARRWQRPWSVRALALGHCSGRTRIMHVLHASMAEAGLEISEQWQIPYLLSIEEFPRREASIRLSRKWNRGLVASNRELAGALNHDFHIPMESIHSVPRSLVLPESLETGPRKARSNRLPVIGAAGPLVAGSGFSTFLNAARKVVDAGVDAEFLIAGQGEDEGDLRKRAQRLRIAERLTFADEIPEGLTFWDVLDVYCQTSVSPTVGRPLALAMAAGVPSIVSDVQGLRSLVEDGVTGAIVPQGDSAALARSILEMLDHPARAKSLGESARQALLHDGHPGREAQRLDELYRTISRAWTTARAITTLPMVETRLETMERRSSVPFPVSMPTLEAGG